MYLDVGMLKRLKGLNVKVIPLTHRAKNRIRENGDVFTVKDVFFMVDGMYSHVDLLLEKGTWFGRFQLDKEIEVIEVF